MWMLQIQRATKVIQPDFARLSTVHGLQCTDFLLDHDNLTCFQRFEPCHDSFFYMQGTGWANKQLCKKYHEIFYSWCWLQGFCLWLWLLDVAWLPRSFRHVCKNITRPQNACYLYPALTILKCRFSVSRGLPLTYTLHGSSGLDWVYVSPWYVSIFAIDIYLSKWATDVDDPCKNFVWLHEWLSQTTFVFENHDSLAI